MRVWVSGYRSYELGIFDQHDKKLKVIKEALRQSLEQLLDEGLDWLITGGQLGVEQWSLEVAAGLQKDYPELRTALMEPFADFGKNWNEANQTNLAVVKSKATFSAAVSDKPYHSPQQLRNYQAFMLSHTDQALFIYDPQAPAKLHYTIEAIQRFQETHDYRLVTIDFDTLQEVADNLANDEENGFQAE
ncbi:DUF1273 domain-containing protein [Loigolactobacillus backii]|uniref:DUF1273 domain-containing protein n=1 Tax=Loigolactobacillus backii TaxID=375175 RepID=UPI0007F0D21B|nr:DUF1273 domain-containing protein [Loigolactobacillus backii]ANK59521.1 hypothetical protein AYR52_04230 [Loigolactobacillus backii]ANK64514.1 hypothetical protein AYR54_04235 [Loigolactobacillus backii]ANK67090.1 hypothetical protein AYR55_04795 [Loigolactobacillus backii]MDA5387056.1 DUF1273 domain-containing protein [Loigolactobacillus backii]MDA5389593.1 DUF1273 domain-containing protein [Loigolactobacillus backii]